VGRQIDWENLGFNYIQTDCFIKYVWQNGAWSQGELLTEPYLNLHIAATALHYGQSAFEGLKAFHGKDGDIRVFRPLQNARRMARTARRICMPEVPEDMFVDAIERVIQANRDYVPPYGTGGALYIRPLLFGSSPQIGVSPAEEYIFLVMVLPVGPYYKGGLQPVRAVVLEDYDRAAPQGVGNVKVAGNYAASLEPHAKAHEQGFAVELYLDSKEHTYIEEFGTSNFVAINGQDRFITPTSSSILPSITNDSLQHIAQDMDIPVEKRPIPFDEVSTLKEAGACGTAVVLTPVNEIVRNGRSYRVGPEQGCGEKLEVLYENVTGIQHGDKPDPYGWILNVDSARTS